MGALEFHPNGPIHDTQWSLFTVAEAARRLDTRSYELDARAKLRHELVVAVCRVIDGAVAVLERVIERFDGPQPVSEAQAPADTGVFHLLIDELVEDAGPNPGQRVADVAFMACWELRRKRERVREAEHGGDDDWRLIAACCSARRRVPKALAGVEQILAELDAVPSLFAELYRTERQLAVESRAAYYAFVRGLRALERDPRYEGVDRCLRLVGTGIAQLIGREIYEDLRVEDRQALRELQVRLFAWLRGPRDERAGWQLLSEVFAFGSLLMQINRRPPLVEHDRAVLERLRERLREPVGEDLELRERLPTLRGRDPELDALIEARAAFVPALWREPVARALVSLGERAAA